MVQVQLENEKWDVFNFANKQRLLDTVKAEFQTFYSLCSVPQYWENPTASGHWQVRDLVGHMVDVIEGYLERFDLARRGQEAPPPYGLKVMASRLDERARAFRGTPREELLTRFSRDYETLMVIFEGLSEPEWTGLLVSHPYMGPVPACCYPIFQIMDYSVHKWDIREKLGVPHGLGPDAADFLVPWMFVLWQGTTDLDRVGPEPIRVGFRVSGRNGGTWRVQVDREGYKFEPGPVDDLPTVFEFDPASLVLTAFGRIRAGTAYGDQAIAQRYRELFFSI